FHGQDARADRQLLSDLVFVSHGPRIIRYPAGMLAAADERFAARAAEAERLGKLPRETVAEFIELGVPRMLMPKRWGGLELGPPAGTTRRIAGCCSCRGTTSPSTMRAGTSLACVAPAARPSA